MIRSILYATDLGIYAPVVMQHALGLAHSFNADLYVVHVVEPMGLFAESVLQSYLDEQALNALHQQGISTMLGNIEHRIVDSLRDELAERQQELALIRSVKVIQGEPSQVILEQSQMLAVDLLILGSHGQPSGDITHLGRTAARVVELAQMPVYLVPLLQRRRPTDG
ncbi:MULTISPECIES: universal stress protein [Pseudomonas]|jgi:nucleotide-binding universal stress UspA family protein|uniref:universal stress protein n=1 Tax=Pseudomonas TaxID=286 RepID=UPI000288444F|nr:MULTISPECIES: universal stress protein [Pseudomonas]AMB78934.1 universal stress protein UspA [Pseudomonas fragi]MCB1655128.1 universal stress protein [Pseudomonadales bacterium]NNG63536.1 universal stress protein [Pseudomonas sp. GC01]AUB74630.1 universal stress protein UspA [Pseudomonas sp. Lz4W]MCH4869028.1 universal stress protein [Pseudomonas sp. TMW22089]